MSTTQKKKPLQKTVHLPAIGGDHSESSPTKPSHGFVRKSKPISHDTDQSARNASSTRTELPHIPNKKFYNEKPFYVGKPNNDLHGRKIPVVKTRKKVGDDSDLNVPDDATTSKGKITNVPKNFRPAYSRTKVVKRINFADGSDSDTSPNVSGGSNKNNNQTKIGTTTKLPPIKTQNTSKDLGIDSGEEKSETDDNQASPPHTDSGPTIGSHNKTGRRIRVKKKQPDYSQEVDNPKALSEAEQKSKNADDAKVAERRSNKRSHNKSIPVVMDSEDEDEKGEAGSQKLVKRTTKSVAESLGISKDGNDSEDNGNDSEDNGSDSKDDAKTNNRKKNPKSKTKLDKSDDKGGEIPEVDASKKEVVEVMNERSRRIFKKLPLTLDLYQGLGDELNLVKEVIQAIAAVSEENSPEVSEQAQEAITAEVQKKLPSMAPKYIKLAMKITLAVGKFFLGIYTGINSEVGDAIKDGLGGVDYSGDLIDFGGEMLDLVKQKKLPSKLGEVPKSLSDDDKREFAMIKRFGQPRTQNLPWSPEEEAELRAIRGKPKDQRTPHENIRNEVLYRKVRKIAIENLPGEFEIDTNDIYAEDLGNLEGMTKVAREHADWMRNARETLRKEMVKDVKPKNATGQKLTEEQIEDQRQRFNLAAAIEIKKRLTGTQQPPGSGSLGAAA
jgi:hypothetical protein